VVDWQLKEGIVFQKIARELESFALDKMDFKEIELGGLELYNQDFDDENKPPDGGLFYFMFPPAGLTAYGMPTASYRSTS
jgi:hypothetical protein